MNETQTTALNALLEIECKIDSEGCDGPWCTARAQICEEFGLELPKAEISK